VRAFIAKKKSLRKTHRGKIRKLDLLAYFVHTLSVAFRTKFYNERA
jgi:hypothetical protein